MAHKHFCLKCNAVVRSDSTVNWFAGFVSDWHDVLQKSYFGPTSMRSAMCREEVVTLRQLRDDFVRALEGHAKACWKSVHSNCLHFGFCC